MNCTSRWWHPEVNFTTLTHILLLFSLSKEHQASLKTIPVLTPFAIWKPPVISGFRILGLGFQISRFPRHPAFLLLGQSSQRSRGGEWYPENSGSRKFLFQSRNLEGVLNESQNLVFLCFFASWILEFLAARSRSLGFLFFWSTVSIETMIKLFIWLKTYDSSLLNM